MNYLSLSEVLAMHAALIDTFGGIHGVRDLGALEAALYRPQHGYYNHLIQQAAALMESLAMNHPFLDGNKRIAFFATDVFLRLNGYVIQCDGERTYQHFMTLFENGEFNFAQLEVWLTSCTNPA